MPARAYPDLTQALKIILLYWFIQLIVGYASSPLIRAEPLRTLITYCLSHGILLLIIFRRKVETEGPQKLIYKAPVAILVCVCLVVATAAIGSCLDPLSHLLPVNQLEEWAAREFSKLNIGQNHFLSLGTMVIAPTFFEELIFRRVLLDGFLKRYSTPKAILLSSFLFGVIHINPGQVIAGLAFGTFLGWIYASTRNLAYCIGVHALNNLIAYLVFLNLEEDSFLELFGIKGYALFVVFGFVLLIASVALLRKQFNKRPLGKVVKDI